MAPQNYCELVKEQIFQILKAFFYLTMRNVILWEISVKKRISFLVFGFTGIFSESQSLGKECLEPFKTQKPENCNLPALIIVYRLQPEKCNLSALITVYRLQPENCNPSALITVYRLQPENCNLSALITVYRLQPENCNLPALITVYRLQLQVTTKEGGNYFF